MMLVRHRYATSLLFPCLIALALAARVRAQDPSAAFEGRKITEISFDPVQQPLEPSEIHRILPLKQNEAYGAASLRAAIERLYATGRYRDIEVDAHNAGDGVALRFITKSSWFVGHVGVESDPPEPPSAAQVVNASRLNLGMPFDPGQLEAAEDNIRALLVGNGYFNPVVSHRLDYDAEYGQVSITFTIDSGKRARYATPAISGNTASLNEPEIIGATHWRRFLFPGYRGITQAKTRAGIDGIRLRYQNLNRLLAVVTLKSIDANPDGKSATPHVTVEAGPLVEVKAQGAKAPRKDLKQNVPVFEEHTVDADLLAEGASNLRDYFQARGYFEVKVTFQQTEIRQGRTEIDYIILPGARHRLVWIGIEGNRYFDRKTIRERMFLETASIEFRRGRYSEALRRRDEDAITSLYQSNGFRDVRIESSVVDDYKGKSSDYAAMFRIQEGPQYRVAALEVVGARKLDLTGTIQSLSSQEGQVFSAFNIATDRETIIRQYGENGFANAAFDWDEQPGPRPHTVALRFTIDEGPQQFVRQVVATGLATTRPQLVKQQLGLHSGDPLSPSAMAETQRRLYDLGIFAKVDMAIQNQDGQEDRKYILFDLEEARRYSITGGFGAEFRANRRKQRHNGSVRSRGRARSESARIVRSDTAEFSGRRAIYRPSEPAVDTAEAGGHQLLRTAHIQFAAIRCDFFHPVR